ncbi:hypothetical protein [Massilia scottii]|uniref:hypothetical protein n=1 Tax=Massilia scottii TaxID=3057166 RepID=UPI0006BB8620|nr:hypothetical protein [Massilia sp. CCM 9029]MDQ1834093.1 hypothetical protein [Massilia sp. CCM 9029]CUI04701.1 hypothetical protein BN2497_4179 [Janthinobacterium sp. CG23_2]CUU28487.1 hypothetical protein BN3177_4179 [Janthinobacterium sp. CG23_2]
MNARAPNPHFGFVERAPYELGYLLNKLPVDFSSRSKLTADERLIAQAASMHASNANSELMNGLEALGQVIAHAALNPDRGGLDKHQMMSLGALVKHVAVEAQFLQELDFRLSEALGADSPAGADSPGTPNSFGGAA